MRISGHEHDSIIHLQLNSDLIFLKGKVKEEIINWDPNKFQFGQDCIDLFRSYQRKHWSEQLWQIQPFFSAKSAQSHSCLPHWSGRECEIAQYLCDCHQVWISDFNGESCKPQPCVNLEWTWQRLQSVLSHTQHSCLIHAFFIKAKGRGLYSARKKICQKRVHNAFPIAVLYEVADSWGNSWLFSLDI